MLDYKIIDCHIHPFIQKEDNCEFFECFDNSDEMFAKLKSHGVTQASGAVIINRNVDNFAKIQQLNRDAMTLYSKYPDFYIPGISFHGDYIEESCAEIEQLKAKYNVKVLGEVLSYVSGCQSFSASYLNPIWELAIDLDMLVSIHRISLEDTLELAKRFPKLKIMLAHPGDRNVFTASLDAIKDYKNITLDLSGTGLFRYGMLQYGVKTIGAERFTFGSDYPICNASMYIHGVLAEGLSRRDNELIFAENFLRLIN